jgi:hypothetical protein
VNERARAGVASGVAEAFAPTISIRTNLWFNWAMIAIEHETEAVRNVVALRDNWTAPGARRDILVEMHPAMVAIVASALSIDSLHADIAPALGREPNPRSSGKRAGYMLQTLTTAYPSVRKCTTDFDWLFRIRGDAAHFQGSDKGTVPHPDLPTNVAVENVMFSARSATRAVNVLFAIFGAVLTGATDVPKARDWGAARAHVLDQMRKRRTG